MAYRHGLQNFSKGVLSKELWGRSDIAPYNAGVRQGTNVIILKYGGLQKRPGTRLVYEITDGEKRLIPFEGAYEASYAMLMGQETMRLAALGGMVIEQKLTVQAVALLNPVRITANYHGYATGDEVYFSDIEGADGLNGLTLPVTTISQHVFSVPIDGSSLSALTGDSGGIIRTGAPAAPPAPPPVPPPAAPPPDPDTTTPSYPERPPRLCVSVSSLILMADGSEQKASNLRVGDRVRTRHEISLEWGEYRIIALTFAKEPTLRSRGWPDATPDHRFALPLWLARLLPIRWRWFRMRHIGRHAREDIVIRMTVEEAHTYMARHPSSSRWRLCHNMKQYETFS